MRPIFHLSVFDVNQWGSEGIVEWGKVKISLSNPRGGKSVLNPTASGQNSRSGGKMVL